MVIVYGGKAKDQLNQMRYETYCMSAASAQGELKAEKLPPTERATYFHSLRSHLQSVVWKYLRTEDLDPLKWGWYLVSGQLAPIMTDIQPAPADLMNIVRCKCRTPCSTMLCSCRKRGHNCFSACEHCHGKSCTNAHGDSVTEVHGDAAGCVTCLDDVLYDNDLEWLMEETVDSVDVAAEVRKVEVVKEKPNQLRAKGL
jgi:hypothetical protein